VSTQIFLLNNNNMPKTKQQKEETVKDLAEKLSKTKTVIFTNFDGLNVTDTTELRNLLRENNIDYAVTKRTLIKLALADADLKDIDVSQLEGGLGVALGYDDEILPAKILGQFAKKHDKLIMAGGIFDGKFIDAKQVVELSKMAGKDELRGKLVWLLNYPASGFVNALAGNIKNLVYALQAIKDKK
jgi:large subunit ribosomal protein L10